MISTSEMPPHEFPPEATSERSESSRKKPNGEAPKGHAASPYPVTWVSDAVLKLDAQPVLKGLIERGSFVMIYGPSGSGKSFFTADIAQHIATGESWRGRKCPQGLVVYVASEAGASILKRFIGWRDRRACSIARLPLAVLTRGPNLLDDLEVARLCDQLAALQDEAKMPLALTTFDTLSRSIPGGDENSAEDMTMVIRAADILRDRFNSATGYVHHSGKDPDKGARGHSALFAASDLVLRIMDGVATVDKVRDGVAGERFAFTLEPIELGLDADGDPVMTCLLNAADSSSSKPKSRAPISGKNQKVLIGPLRELVAEAGQSMPGTSAIPQGVRAVSFEALVQRALPKFPGTDEWRAKQRITEAVMGMQANGHIGVHGDWLWLI